MQVTHNLVEQARQPGPNKIRLVDYGGYDTFIDRYALERAMNFYRDDPSAMLRSLLRTLVGEKTLAQSSARGRSTTPGRIGVPEDILQQIHGK